MSAAPREGGRVQHTNTRRVGTVLQRVRKSWGYDLLVQPDAPFFPDWKNEPTWWDEDKVRVVEGALAVDQ